MTTALPLLPASTPCPCLAPGRRGRHRRPAGQVQAAGRAARARGGGGRLPPALASRLRVLHAHPLAGAHQRAPLPAVAVVAARGGCSACADTAHPPRCCALSPLRSLLQKENEVIVYGGEWYDRCAPRLHGAAQLVPLCCCCTVCCCSCCCRGLCCCMHVPGPSDAAPLASHPIPCSDKDKTHVYSDGAHGWGRCADGALRSEAAP